MDTPLDIKRILSFNDNIINRSVPQSGHLICAMAGLIREKTYKSDFLTSNFSYAISTLYSLTGLKTGESALDFD
jgi:hypothetical protein